MKFEHLIDHSEGWSGDENYSSVFKQFIDNINWHQDMEEYWEGVVFPAYRPIPVHLIKVRVLTPFGTDHTCKVRFSCYQSPNPFVQKTDGYHMRFFLNHDKYLQPGAASIGGAFNIRGAISAVEMGSLFYDNIIEQWLNRVYLQVIGEQ